MRIRDSLDALVVHVQTKTRAGFEEAFQDFASRGYRLVFRHGCEFRYAGLRHSIVAGTLRVPGVEFGPDSMPVARP